MGWDEAGQGKTLQDRLVSALLGLGRVGKGTRSVGWVLCGGWQGGGWVGEYLLWIGQRWHSHAMSHLTNVNIVQDVLQTGLSNAQSTHVHRHSQ